MSNLPAVTVTTACFDGRLHGFLTRTKYATVYALSDGGLFCKGHDDGGSGTVLRYVPAGTDIGVLTVDQVRARCKSATKSICTTMTSSAAIARAFSRPNVICSA